MLCAQAGEGDEVSTCRRLYMRLPVRHNNAQTKLDQSDSGSAAKAAVLPDLRTFYVTGEIS